MLIYQFLLFFSILMPTIFYARAKDYSEIKPGQYPYIMFFDGKIRLANANVTGVGVLITNKLIVADQFSAKA